MKQKTTATKMSVYFCAALPCYERQNTQNINIKIISTEKHIHICSTTTATLLGKKI